MEKENVVKRIKRFKDLFVNEFWWVDVNGIYEQAKHYSSTVHYTRVKKRTNKKTRFRAKSESIQRL